MTVVNIPKTVNYVKTEIPNGCVISCLAMITNKSFMDVIEDMQQYWDNEGSTEGIDDPAWYQYLASEGFAVQDISQEYIPQDRLLYDWPLAPFAPIHMCFVHDRGPHAIILDEDGVVFDPNAEFIKDLSEYHRVYRMVGIWKVSQMLEI